MKLSIIEINENSYFILLSIFDTKFVSTFLYGEIKNTNVFKSQIHKLLTLVELPLCYLVHRFNFNVILVEENDVVLSMHGCKLTLFSQQLVHT